MYHRFLWLLPLMAFAMPAEAGKNTISLSLASLGEPQISFKTVHRESCPLGEVLANKELLELGIADLNFGQLLGSTVLEEQLRGTKEDPSAVSLLQAGRVPGIPAIAQVCKNLGLLDHEIPLILKKFQAVCFWGNIAPIQNTGEAFDLIQSGNLSNPVFLSFDHYDPEKEILPRVYENLPFNVIVLGDLELSLFIDFALARLEDRSPGSPFSTVFLGHWRADVSAQDVDEIEVVLNAPHLRHTVHGQDGFQVSFVEPDMVGSIVFKTSQGQKATGYSRRVLARVKEKDDE